MPNLKHKHTQQLDREQLLRLLAVLRKEKSADLKLTNLSVLDLINGDVTSGPIVIDQGYIVAVGPEADTLQAKRTVDCNGQIATPGFIDGHMHVETSTMTPFEFERTTLPLGTTSIVCDPHELVNVMGKPGIEWFLRCSEMMRQNMFVQVSSCVPAVAELDINGSDFTLEEMKAYLEHPHVLGLAEVMDYPAVLNGNPDMLDKLAAFNPLNIDGHCPLLSGRELSAYVASGIQNCHETTSYQEGKEKLAKGMAVIMREGSVAKNLDALAPLITDYSSPQCLLCTDDRNPHEIAKEGHINYMVKRLIQHHWIKPHLAYRVASWSAAQHFGLRRLGLLAPGYKADINLVKTLRNVDIQRVVIGGQFVDELNLAGSVADKLRASVPPLQPTMKHKTVTADELAIPLTTGDYHVIEIVKDELLTNHLVCRFDGQQFDKQGVNRLAVVERYGHQLPPAMGLVKGFELNQGAIATSVGHDSHNIVAIGADKHSMALAINHLLTIGGGYCVVQNDNVTADLKLPLGGIMSLDSSEAITDQIIALKQAAQTIGVEVAEPFVQMSFLALPVIPSLKMTVKGLVDVEKFELIDLQL
ncbi:adenine deaminase [Photobacterium chitinilyticum]|uniref:Adenine deaminase n=1 Tax=Photobacterium chitinilyticum TaxID=2485123 RepID=A0A3S3R1Y3_9GAMM|nr:adenine deaminase [Photobacterium chitinilyticum]RWX56184.1 adenine deaminase [Photobacterium chitinilyticum]